MGNNVSEEPSASILKVVFEERAESFIRNIDTIYLHDFTCKDTIILNLGEIKTFSTAMFQTKIILSNNAKLSKGIKHMYGFFNRLTEMPYMKLHQAFNMLNK